MQIKNIYIFARSNGGLAQLARAFDWQSKGHGFDSHILHLIIKELQRLNFVTLFFNTQINTQCYFLNRKIFFHLVNQLRNRSIDFFK